MSSHRSALHDTAICRFVKLRRHLFSQRATNQINWYIHHHAKLAFTSLKGGAMSMERRQSSGIMPS